VEQALMLTAEAIQTATVATSGPPEHQTVMERIPANIRASLTPAQIAQLVKLLEPAQADHQVDYRVSSTWFGRRFYFALFAGTEKRSQRRLVHEGQRRSFSLFLFEAFFVNLAVTLLICGLLLVMVMGLFWVLPDHGIELFDGAAQLIRHLLY
jgi:hypothetical protein